MPVVKNRPFSNGTLPPFLARKILVRIIMKQGGYTLTNNDEHSWESNETG